MHSRLPDIIHLYIINAGVRLGDIFGLTGEYGKLSFWDTVVQVNLTTMFQFQ